MGYTAGIIGTGGIAGMGILGMHSEDQIGKEKVRASHAGGYSESDEIKLVAVADVDADKLSKFGEAWDIPADNQYTSHKEMLQEEKLDVVSVCTPSYLHHDHVIESAQSPKSPSVIWCEKPIASSIRDAEEMTEVCSKTNTELVVNHSFRFTSKLQRLKRLIQQENLLGEIQSVSAQYRMELLRNSTHVLDTILYLMDANVDHLSGYISGENEAVDALGATQGVDDAAGGGHLVMDNGAFVNVDCTIPRDTSSMTFQFIGSNGKLYMNNDDGEWRYWRLEEGNHIEQGLPEIENAWTWDRDYRQAFPNAASHIADLLTGRDKNLSTGEEATRSLEIIIGFYISHYTGGRIQFPIDPPLREVPITSW